VQGDDASSPSKCTFLQGKNRKANFKDFAAKRSTWGGKTAAAGVGLMEGLMECCVEEGRGIGEDLNL
jgi:hypothetical protein